MRASFHLSVTSFFVSTFFVHSKKLTEKRYLRLLLRSLHSLRLLRHDGLHPALGHTLHTLAGDGVLRRGAADALGHDAAAALLRVVLLVHASEAALLRGLTLLLAVELTSRLVLVVRLLLHNRLQNGKETSRSETEEVRTVLKSFNSGLSVHPLQRRGKFSRDARHRLLPEANRRYCLSCSGTVTGCDPVLPKDSVRGDLTHNTCGGSVKISLPMYPWGEHLIMAPSGE